MNTYNPKQSPNQPSQYTIIRNAARKVIKRIGLSQVLLIVKIAKIAAH